MSHEVDLLQLKKSMGEFPKLAPNDDIKVDWDENHLGFIPDFLTNNLNLK